MKTTVTRLSSEVETSRGDIAGAEGAAEARRRASGSTASEDPFKAL